MGIDCSFILEVRTPAAGWQWRGGRSLPKPPGSIFEAHWMPRNRGFHRFLGEPMRGLPEDACEVVRTAIRKTFGGPSETTLSWIGFDELLRMRRRVHPDHEDLYRSLVDHVQRELRLPPEEIRLILEFS